MLSASTTSLNVAAQSKACRANACAPLSARPTFSPMQAQPMQHSLWLAPSQAVQTQRYQPVAAAAMRGGSGEKWWQKETPNMRNINSVQELVDQLADAGDNLVIVDFYGQWCGACRALYPKLLKLMEQFPDVVFLKVDFDNNKAMCKTLGVKVLPYFHIYHGAEGRVAAFSCTTSKFQRMRDALEEYYTPICSLEDNPGLPEFPEIIPHPHPNELSRVGGAEVAAARELMAAAPAAEKEPALA